MANPNIVLNSKPDSPLPIKPILPLLAAALLAAIVGTSPSRAQTAVDFDPIRTTLLEESTPDPTLSLKYRLFPFAEVDKTEVDCDGTAIPFQATPFFDNPLNVTALLILVDTSTGERNLPRNLTIEQNKLAISGILEKARPNLLIGLSQFSNDLVELTPVGAPFDKTREAAAKLEAKGPGTRLYRCGIEAIKKLSATQADRKALLLFSDGKDEDTGFTLNDLVEEAKKNNILVMAVGCPESQQGIPNLGNMERLAKETYGFYAQTDLVDNRRPGFFNPSRQVPKNPDKLPSKILDSLVGGGQVVAALKTLNPNGKITVTLTTKSGQKLSKTLQRTPRGSASPTPSPAASPGPAGSPAQRGNATVVPPPPPANNTVLILSIIGAVLALGGGLALVLVSASRKKQSPPHPVPLPINVVERDEIRISPEPHIPLPSGKCLARLRIQDAEGSALSVTKTATRIGRRPDNDIVFSNDSVSGHHALLHMGRDGTFSITDTQSGNGVVVNGHRIQQAELQNGDLVELGEVRFRFQIN
jgi:hypothetical protein